MLLDLVVILMLNIDSSISILLLTLVLMEHLVRDVEDLLLLSRVRVLPHGRQRPLKQIVHGLETAALKLGQDEEEDHYAEPGGAAEEEEGAVAHLAHHVGDGRGDAVGDEPLETEAERHADGADARGEDLGGNDVGGDRVSEGPADGVEVDENDADDATSGGALAGLDVGEAQVQTHVHHGSTLDEATDKQRETTADAVHDAGDVDDGGHQLDDAVDTNGEQGAGAGGDTDHGEDLGREVVEGVGAGELLEEEEQDGEHEAAAVARAAGERLEDGDVVEAAGVALLSLGLGADLGVLLVDVGVILREVSELAQVPQTLFRLALGDEGSGSLDDDYGQVISPMFILFHPAGHTYTKS